MKKEKKALAIDKLEQEFSKATIGILTDYRGLRTSEVDGLRRKLQDAGGDYKVIKNTMAIKALEKLDRNELATKFIGPVAIAFGYDEEIQTTAKIFADYMRASKLTIGVKGGFMGDTVINSEQVTTLATLPPKPVVLAKVVGSIKSPLYAIAGVLAAPIRNLQGALKARINQLEVTE